MCVCCALLPGIRSLVRVGKARAPRPDPVLYPLGQYTTLYLNRFRGEPAISGFDWPFTPIHKSSSNFSTLSGPVLQCMLLHLQPAHG